MPLSSGYSKQYTQPLDSNLSSLFGFGSLEDISGGDLLEGLSSNAVPDAPLFGLGTGNFGATPAPAAGGNFLSEMLGGEDALSNIGGLLQGGAGLFNAFTGYKGLGLQEDALNFNKATTRANFANEAKMVNSQLEDRQRARRASAGGEAGKYESVSTYMDKNSVAGTI